MVTPEEARMQSDPDDSGHGDLDHSALVDVTGIPLDQLLPSTESVLARSLQALVRETSRPQEVISAFGNFAPDDPFPS
jgi:FXSXX-COOH protein